MVRERGKGGVNDRAARRRAYSLRRSGAGRWPSARGGRVRVRWRDPVVRYTTFADGHPFEVEAGGTLAVEEDEARLLEARGWVRVG